MKKTNEKFCIAWATLEQDEDLELINRFAAIQLGQAKKLGLSVIAEKDENENKVFFFILGKKAKQRFLESELDMDYAISI